MAPPFIYRVDELQQAPRTNSRYVENEWRPPRPEGFNVITNEGSWLVHTGRADAPSQDMPCPPDQIAPSGARHFRTISMYYSDGTFWIVPYDASRCQVGNGLQDSSENHEDSDSDEEMDDESDSTSSDEDDNWQDWKQLSFHDARLEDYTSYATMGGPHTTLLVQRPGRGWQDKLLPDRYHTTRVAGGPYGGLVGQLPILIGLIAFSARSLYVTDTLKQCVSGNQWRVTTRPHREGWTNRRGIVVRTFTYTPHRESTNEQLQAFENGELGKAYY